MRVFSPPRLKIPSLVPVVVCCQKVPFLKSFAHWQYVGRAFGSPKKVSSSKTDTCFLMEQTCKPQYQRASKYLPSFDIENWYDQSKVIWTPNTYTAHCSRRMTKFKNQFCPIGLLGKVLHPYLCGKVIKVDISSFNGSKLASFWTYFSSYSALFAYCLRTWCG